MKEKAALIPRWRSRAAATHDAILYVTNDTFSLTH